MMLARGTAVSRIGILAPALAWCCVLGAARVEARTVEALQCQSKVWRAVAEVAPSCRGVGVDRICSGAALGRARNRTERILVKHQSAAPPGVCVPMLCATSETPFACADTLVSGNGAQREETLDDWQSGDFRCLRRSARVLGRLAKQSRRCERDPAERAACLDQVVTSHAAKLEQVVGTFVGAGASLHRCLFGSCRPNADIRPCVHDVVADATGEPPPSGGDPGGGPPPPDPGPPDPGDMTAQEIECRTVSPVVLAEYDERVAKCLADSDDVPQCILQAREKREEKVAGLLDKRVRPQVCFPGICTPEQTAEACAAAVFDLHTPGAGGTPDPDPDPEPAQLCRASARAILDELADDLAACAAHDAEQDVEACLQAAVDLHRPDLVAHLEEQLAEGIAPDDCLPVLCAGSGEPAACADAAIASVVDQPSSTSSTTSTSSTSSTSVGGQGAASRPGGSALN
jgi:hypothetical protein